MFEYSFHITPSSGAPLPVHVHFLADRPDLAPTVASACFSEWTDEIVNDFGIPTREAYVREIQENKMNTHAPFVLVASTAEVSERVRGVSVTTDCEPVKRGCKPAMMMWPRRW